MVRNRLPGLDGLRGLAVLAVVLHHMDLAHGGYVGVDIFFVLSGFLITSILVAEVERVGRIRLRRFYWRRLLRLYPALLVLTAFVVAVALAARTAVADTTYDSLATVAYLANVVDLRSGLLDHAWTLAMEEQFYLVWPLLLAFGLRSSRPELRWLPSLLLVLLVLALDLYGGQDGAMHTYVRAMGLPLGCALALAPAMRPRLGRLGWPCLAGLALLVFLPGPGWMTTGWPVSAAAVLAVPAVAMLSESAPRPFGGTVLQWLGLRSYSLYLWHFPLLSLAVHNAPSLLPYPLRLTAGVFAALVAAEASYRLIEQPALRWRDRRNSGVSADHLAADQRP